MPNTVVISTTANDVHASFLEEALPHAGWQCYRWINSDLPIAQVATIELMCTVETLMTLSAQGQESTTINPSKVVFLNRRRVEYQKLNNEIHDKDKPIAERELQRFSDNLIHLLGTSEWPVNDVGCARRAENKAYQLQVAKTCGLLIPKTCITSATDKAVEFIRSCGTVGCLAKPFRGAMWKNGEDIFVSYSALVTVEDVRNSMSLRFSPTIFQEYIPKLFEVRINAFDRTFIGARINSQKDARTEVDWRTVSPRYLDIEEIEIPEPIVKRCGEMMRRLGLVFGCFDFIVDRSMNWIFIEINQMGQFLWIEQANRDIPLLDMFVQLLTRRGQVVRAPQFGIRFENLAAAAYERLRAEKSNRVPLRAVGFVQEDAPAFNEETNG